MEDGRVRAVIDAVLPCVDGGRFGVKRIAGERVEIEAHCFTDGHDVLRAMRRGRAEDEKDWREVLLEEDVVVEDSIIMDYGVLRRGARVRRAIIDRYNVIQPGERIGYDAGSDRARGEVTKSGIVAIPVAPLRGEAIMNE